MRNIQRALAVGGVIILYSFMSLSFNAFLDIQDKPNAKLDPNAEKVFVPNPLQLGEVAYPGEKAIAGDLCANIRGVQKKLPSGWVSTPNGCGTKFAPAA
jgi:hypothetical protein